MKRLIIAVMLLVGVVFSVLGQEQKTKLTTCPQGWTAGPDVDWKIFWNDALTEARQRGKKIFALSTGSDWCGWCMKLKKEVLTTEEFKAFARKNLVLLYLDSPRKPLPEAQTLHNRAVCRELRLAGGVPCAAVFSADARRLGVLSGGGYTASNYVERLEKMLTEKGELPKNGQPSKIFTEGYTPSSNAVQSAKKAVANPQGEESKANRQATAVSHVGAGLYDKDGTRLVGYPCTGVVARISAVVTNISESACKDLGYAKSIEVDPANRFYKSFEGCLYDKNMFTLVRCPNVSQMKIPEGVKCIGPHAFEYLKELANVDIPSSVVEIGECAFYGSKGFESVTIPEGVTNIGACAFCYCKSLKSIMVPSSVKSIRARAFGNCWGLKSAVFMLGVESIGPQAFIQCPQLASVRIPSSVRMIGRNFETQRESLGWHVFEVVNQGWSADNPMPSICEELKIVADKGDEDRVREMLYQKSLYTDRVRQAHERRRKAIEERGGRWRTIKVVAGNVLGEVQPKKSDEALNEKRASSVAPTNVVKWTYEIVNGVVVLGGRGKTAVPKDTSGDLVIPEKIDGKPVCSIGELAFSGCRGLKSVTIPLSVTNIRRDAFRVCTNLMSVTIPSSVTNIGWWAFYGCSGLKSVTIPSSLTSIGESAFEGCSGLADKNGFVIVRDTLYDFLGKDTSVTIPSGVTRIGRYTFSGRGGLESVTIPKGVTNIGERAFEGCSGLTSVTIPSSVTSIGDAAFKGCCGLKSVTIPSSVTNIGWSVFENCSGLTSLSILPGVTSIGWNMFWGCSNLTSVTIPSTVTNIVEGAFRNCSGLRSVVMPSSVTRIVEGAFWGCSGLHEFAVSPDNPNYSSVNGLLLSKQGDSLLQCVSGDVSIPSSVTNIDAWAFMSCIDSTFKFSVSEENPKYSSVNGLLLSKKGDLLVQGINGDVTIPPCVTSIGGGAFQFCDGLRSVMIPPSVTNIEGSAFDGCRGLTSVTIPSSVRSIGKKAFSGCRRLETIYVDEGDENRVKSMILSSGASVDKLKFVKKDDVKAK